MLRYTVAWYESRSELWLEGEDEDGGKRGEGVVAIVVVEGVRRVYSSACSHRIF